MSPKDKDKTADIAHLSIEEKIKLLSDPDREYLNGYLDRALEENAAKKRKNKPLSKTQA
ncbi:MAG: hypothetical protein LBN12_03720 [Clostridiales Family XIII bacterium]|jgi:hypothetical protein|nr:hypothetical protein [Clostridiales Family XIII bacterium]